MDNLTKKQRSICMSKIRSKNTKPELKVRKFLTEKKIRYRLHTSKLPGKPDIVIGKSKLAIFINGCFWHNHKNCKHAVMPKSNLGYWRDKLKKNVDKQRKALKQLKEDGWKSILIWECQLNNEAKTNKIFNKIIKAINEE